MENTCHWCGCDISSMARSAKFCGSKCKDMARYEKRTGNKPGGFREERKCLICDKSFTAKTSTRKYCGSSCRNTAKAKMNLPRKAELARKYRSENPEKYREYDRAKRALRIDHYRAMERARYQKMKEYDQDGYKMMLLKQTENERKRNAQKQIEKLIAPW